MCGAGTAVEEVFPEALQVIEPPAGRTRNEFGKEFLTFLDYLVDNTEEVSEGTGKRARWRITPGALTELPGKTWRAYRR